MTAIVGLIGKDKTIYIGGDSACVAGLSITVRKDPKVFINGPFIMGFTSSFRMGHLLHHSFKPPKQSKKISDIKYMNTKFINAIKKCFEDGGYNSGGKFLVGYNGKLYKIDNDFQVGIPMAKFDACGCGEDLCLGSMYSTSELSPNKRIKMALKAAQQFSGGVRKPFIIKSLKYIKN